MSEHCIKCGPVSPNDTYVSIGNIKRHRHPCDGQILEHESPESELQQATERIADLEKELQRLLDIFNSEHGSVTILDAERIEKLLTTEGEEG